MKLEAKITLMQKQFVACGKYMYGAGSKNKKDAKKMGCVRLVRVRSVVLHFMHRSGLSYNYLGTALVHENNIFIAAKTIIKASCCVQD